MHGITERYLSGQKADAAGYVRLMLGDLESRISMYFSRVRSSLDVHLTSGILNFDLKYSICICLQYVDEACHQIERNEKNLRQMGVLPYIPRFAALATRMEQYIQGQSRDLVDQAYTKFEEGYIFWGVGINELGRDPPQPGLSLTHVLGRTNQFVGALSLSLSLWGLSPLFSVGEVHVSPRSSEVSLKPAGSWVSGSRHGSFAGNL
ncbi:hypothetical protein Cgig2_002080 [Carnegiea gigantea]|uniref:Uncharacterized protein n=1 Tax=Carnegiea gigantea TaxID=171969 RepID=A0A9Q1JUY7_9CARY|nr:hypothetical protein Cgig2_002080 [Carnegiea gigantea]